MSKSSEPTSNCDESKIKWFLNYKGKLNPAKDLEPLSR